MPNDLQLLSIAKATVWYGKSGINTVQNVAKVIQKQVSYTDRYSAVDVEESGL